MTEQPIPPPTYSSVKEHLLDELDRLKLLVTLRINPRENPDAMKAELAAVSHRIEQRLGLSLVPQSDAPLPIVRLKKTLSLTDIEVRLLVVLLLRETELSAQEIFSRAFSGTQGVVAQYLRLLFDTPEEQAALLSSLQPSGALRRHGLLLAAHDPAWLPQTPLLYMRLRLTDRVTAFLLGDEHLSSHTLPHGVRLYVGQRSLEQLVLPPGLVDRVREGLSESSLPMLRDPEGPVLPPLCLVGQRWSGRKALLWALFPERSLVVLSAAHLRGRPEFLHETVLAAVAEAAMQNTLIYVSSAELLGELDLPAFAKVRRSLLGTRVRVVLSADGPIDSLMARLPELLQVDFPLPDRVTQIALWNHLLPVDIQREKGFDVRTLAGHHSLPAGAIARCITELCRNARFEEAQTPRLTMSAARDTVRRQLGNRFGDLAQLVTTSLAWEDLVLPPDILDRVLEIVAYARYRDKLLREWGFSQKLPYGRAVSVLFAGPPGTGKTMAAALIAQEIGIELFRVNVARVVDRFAGETEKNLARIFDEAKRQQVALLFDEADTLFGRRLDVRSSQDRYANIAVSFLLQAVESHDGMLFLTTNNEKLLDEAFKRRLRFRILLPLPSETERLRLWESMLPKETPVEKGLNCRRLAEHFDLSGGAIKNAVVRAALRAMVQGIHVTEDLLRQCAKLECEEMGILVENDSHSPELDEEKRESQEANPHGNEDNDDDNDGDDFGGLSPRGLGHDETLDRDL